MVCLLSCYVRNSGLGAFRRPVSAHEPHGRWESIGATAEGWGGPGGAAPVAGTVGRSSVPFRSRPFQCARIGLEGKEAAVGPGAAPIDAQSDFTSIARY